MLSVELLRSAWFNKKRINPIHKTPDACMMKKYLISLNFKLPHNRTSPIVSVQFLLIH